MVPYIFEILQIRDFLERGKRGNFKKFPTCHFSTGHLSNWDCVPYSIVPYSQFHCTPNDKSTLVLIKHRLAICDPDIWFSRTREKQLT